MTTSIGRPCSSSLIKSNVRGARWLAGAIMVISHALDDGAATPAASMDFNCDRRRASMTRSTETGLFVPKKMKRVRFATLKFAGKPGCADKTAA
jgi:hypothetical protein